MVTPVEALDILDFLKENNKISHSLIKRLKECVERFHLDRPLPGSGKRSFLRRNYTCPFFNHGPLGCELAKEYKPYGCLGFNPQSINAQGSGHCRSDQQALELRQGHSKNEPDLNQEICIKNGITWEKESIPVAILDLISKF